MENNYETLRMPELRNYSRLRKAELMAFLQNNERQAQRRQRPAQMSPSGAPPRGTTWEPQREPQTEARQPELEAFLLTKRQLKHRRNKNSKLAKKFKNLEKVNNNLKSQMEALEDKIAKASESTNARFKRKKIRSMKREVDKIAEKLRESEKALKLLESRVPKAPSGAPLKLHPPNRNKRIEAKIDKLNKKIRRAKNRRNKECLLAKRNSLRLDINWGPRLLEGAFSDAYRRYRIGGISGMDPDTFLNRIRRFLIDLLKKELRMGTVRSQTTTWMRFRKDQELVELAFNSRMTNVYNLSD